MKLRVFIAVLLAPLLNSCISQRPQAIDVIHAAGDFYQESGRWPQSKTDLAMGNDLNGHPLDVSRIMSFHSQPQKDGGVKIRWVEGNRLCATMYEITLPAPPATRPANSRNSM